MSDTVLLVLVSGLCLAILALRRRKLALAELRAKLAEIAEAKKRGSHAPQLQYPRINLARCIGCATCVRACPEAGVLAIVHGQSTVVHGSRCVGHAICERECPVDAIRVVLSDLENRRDVPVLDENFEASAQPGLFLAGEVTGFALVKTAILHGTKVAALVAERARARVAVPVAARVAVPVAARVAVPVAVPVLVGAGGPSIEEAVAPEAGPVHELVVVGAGPAGVACSLEARRLGLDFLTLDMADSIGGTVAKYPRRKLVLTQPVDLPLGGRLERTSYRKEELIELWERLAAEHELPLALGQEFRGLTRRADGVFEVETKQGRFLGHQVCLALGRRGTPRKLRVEGEELPKVTYSLVDAAGYRDQKILVVGGGDSAVEAALGLAAQPGNRVCLSYRRKGFFRIKARNEARLESALREGTIDLELESSPVTIEPDRVLLDVKRADGEREQRWLENDAVFVFAGGIPPFKLLESCGVSFDPAERPPAPPSVEPGNGLARALWVALACALLVLAWRHALGAYYGLAPDERPQSPWHDTLRPSSPLGLSFGVLAALLFAANLCFLLRRSRRFAARVPGTLRTWMSVHVATGLLALPVVLVHAAMTPRDTVGGHAFLCLAVLVVTGVVGRYVYAFVPHALSGRELEIDEFETQVGAIAGEWEHEGSAFAAEVRREVHGLVEAERFELSLWRRLWSICRTQVRLAQSLRRLRRLGNEERVPPGQINRILTVARRAHHAAYVARCYGGLHGLLASWRWVHRWVGLAVVVLVVLHVWVALRYGGFLGLGVYGFGR